jgi:exosortase
MTPTRRGESTAFRLTVGVAIAVLSVAYVPVFAQMIRVWWDDPYAGHGMFVPLFSAHAVWIDRDRIRASVVGRDDRGLLLVLAGVAVLVLGHAHGSLLMAGLSFVVTLSGLVLWLWGARTVRAAAFPLGFLVLMVPLPRLFVATVTLHLQLFAARFAALVLSVLEVPVMLRGVTLELPVLTLEVAEVCNGLRFLAALLVLTLAFAHISQPTHARMILLTLSAVPLAILANAVRVTSIALAVQYFGPQAAVGFTHHAIGKGVWGLTIAALVGLGLLLRRGGRSEPVATRTVAVVQADPVVPGR